MSQNPIETETAVRAYVILAHGAGAGMDSDYMQFLSARLETAGFKPVLFNFPYMTKRMLDGGRRPPDRAQKLLDHFREVISQTKAKLTNRKTPLLIGGKSMGGRMASMLAAETPNIADGLVLLGYPFHPPGKPEKLTERTAHFENIKMPTLLIQGERDTFGGRALLDTLTLPKCFETRWMPDGDHSFKPRKKSGRTEEQNRNAAVAAIADKNWS